MTIPVPSPTADPRRFLRACSTPRSPRQFPGRPSPVLPPPKGRTVVLGAGKAGGAMAVAVEALWPADAPMSGLVVTRYDAVPPDFQQLQRDAKSASRSSRRRIRSPTRPARGRRAHRADGARLTADDPRALPDVGRRVVIARATGRRHFA